MGLRLCALTLVVYAGALLWAAESPPTFETAVAPLLTKTCTPCHNENLASGGMVIDAFTKPASLKSNREAWEIILQKLRSGEMPPRGVPRPAQMDALIQFVQSEFEKADRNVKPDPGRVTARRLNRAERLSKNDRREDNSRHGLQVSVHHGLPRPNLSPMPPVLHVATVVSDFTISNKLSKNPQDSRRFLRLFVLPEPGAILSGRRQPRHAGRRTWLEPRASRCKVAWQPD